MIFIGSGANRTVRPSFLRRQGPEESPRRVLAVRAGGLGGGDLVKLAGCAVVYEAANLVLQWDEGVGLDA